MNYPQLDRLQIRKEAIQERLNSEKDLAMDEIFELLREQEAIAIQVQFILSFNWDNLE